MKVTVYPTNQPPKTVEVCTFTDLQKMVGGYIEVAKSTNMGDLLVNEEGLLLNLSRNKHYPYLVGAVILAPRGWDKLPYGN